MSFSNIRFVADGTQTDFLVGFDYLDQSHVSVRVNKVFTDSPSSVHRFSWINANTVRVLKVSGSTPVDAGSLIEVSRQTPIDQPAVVFSGGASLTADKLNRNAEYLTFALQEATDANDAFTKFYLGSFDTSPVTDNVGDPLETGALHYNTSVEGMLVWDGSSWRFFGESVIGNQDYLSAYILARDT